MRRLHACGLRTEKTVQTGRYNATYHGNCPHTPHIFKTRFGHGPRE